MSVALSKIDWRRLRWLAEEFLLNLRLMFVLMSAIVQKFEINLVSSSRFFADRVSITLEIDTKILTKKLIRGNVAPIFSAASRSLMAAVFHNFSRWPSLNAGLSKMADNGCQSSKVLGMPAALVKFTKMR